MGDGVARFAPDPGLHSIRASRFGYGDASISRQVALGSRDSVTLRSLRWSGDVGGSGDRGFRPAPQPGAEVEIAVPAPAVTDGAGRFSIRRADRLARADGARAG